MPDDTAGAAAPAYGGHGLRAKTLDWVEFERQRAEDPRAYFSRLRAQCPVDYDEGHEGWIQILRRSDIDAVLRNPEVFSNLIPELMNSPLPAIPMGVDPPDHAKYRRILDPLFSPRRMAVLEAEVVANTVATIEGFLDNGTCDFATDLAVPLPCSVFLTLFGLPQSDLPALLHMKDAIIRPESLADDPEEITRIQVEAGTQVFTLFGTVLAQRRAEPRDDLITELLRAEIEGRALTEPELLGICFMLMMAGLDTVTISLTCILAYLLEHPEARRSIVANPETIPTVVEELLRWETPVMAVPRIVTRDTEIAGCPIKKGEMVHAMLASGNLDPDADPRAGIVDLDRDDKRHLAFGGGPHRCLGSHLARMELRTVVREWHRLIPEYSLAPGASITWNGNTLRGLDSLALSWPTAGAQA
ncbi:cytochrome P450 [Frankia tisae]|uniref:cytochrome P450 n=1 Tax=Frankia tisae TaxID=2950104 RepID=UPI0021BE90A2|nr:cytochrome P450 [Frankia tisae]